MKKIVSSLLVLCMALALTACGGKEQTLVLRSEQEQNGLYTYAREPKFSPEMYHVIREGFKTPAAIENM